MAPTDPATPACFHDTAELKRLSSYLLDVAPEVMGQHPNAVDAAIHLIGQNPVSAGADPAVSSGATARGDSMVNVAAADPGAHTGIIDALRNEGPRLAVEYIAAAVEHSMPAFLLALSHTVAAFAPAVERSVTIHPADTIALDAPPPAVVAPSAARLTGPFICPTCEREGVTDAVTPGHCDFCGHPLDWRLRVDGKV